MSRRTRTTATLLVLSLALVALAPALPAVREAVITRVLTMLGGSGVSITYRSSSGNAWRSITLHDVEARGLGADVRIDTLQLGYFLPSLLGGELPLDVLVHGATGEVDVKRLLDASAGGAAPGAGGSISLRLRKIDLQDIGVAVAQVPFTLPDASVDSLTVTQDGTALDLSGVITTADGSASLAGRYDALTSSFTGTVAHADATIARHWWDGVTAGTVTGTLTARGSSIEGDFVVSGGAVDDVGLSASGVDGTVALRYPLITAELSGEAFGGRVDATGVVNVVAERWEASGGGTADLAEAVAWVTRSVLPDGVPLAMTGTVNVDLNLVGWETITLQGSASGAGAVEDMALESLRATFGLDADGDLTVDAGARLGGGPLTLTIGTDDGGQRVVASASDVAVSVNGSDLGSVSASLTMAAGDAQSGTLAASWRADLGGRAVSADVDARLDPDGWQAFVTGRDDLGSTAEGAFVLADGSIQGGLTATDVAGLPLSPGARLMIGAAGPLASPTLSVALAGDQPVTLALGPPELLMLGDLRGTATARLDGTAVRDLVGAFGPVGLSGSVELSQLAATLDVTVDQTTAAWGDSASATLSVGSSVLSVAEGALTWSGTVVAETVSVGPVRAAPGELAGTASFGGGQPWSAGLASADDALVFSIDEFGFAVDVSALALSGGAGDVPLQAVVSGSAAPAAVTGSPNARALDLNLTVAAGSSYGPVELADELLLRGTVDLEGPAARLTGRTGGLDLDIDASVGSPDGIDLTATIGSGSAPDLTLEYASGSGRFALVGAAAPQEVLAALGLVPVSAFTAEARADLTGTVTLGPAGPGLADLAGGIDLTMSQPLALSATLTGAGTGFDVVVSGAADAAPITATGRIDTTDLAAVLAGTADDAPAGAGGSGLTVTLGPLDGIVVTTAGASGQGTFDPGPLGPLTIDPLPWRLTADWTDVATPYATLSSRDSAFTLSLSDGRLWLAGAALVPLTYAGDSLALSVTVATDGQPVPVTDLASIPLRGALLHPASATELLSFGGTLADLVVEGGLPAALLATPLPAPLRPDGELRVEARLDLLAGPSYTASLALAAAGASLTGTVTGTGSDLSADLAGTGLELTYAGDTLRLSADQAPLAAFLPAGTERPPTGTLDGTLIRDAGGWRGALNAAVELPLAAASEPPGTGSGGISATVSVLGRGDALELSAAGTGPAGSRFIAAGTVAPDLVVTADVTALDASLAASLRYDAADGLTGTVTSSTVEVEGYASLPPQSAALTWRPGAPLRLLGDGIDVTADLADPDAALSGTVSLPFTLLDAPARLEAHLDGSLAAPSASLEAIGSGLRAVGTGSLSAAHATLSIEEPALGRLLPDVATQYAGLAVSPVTATADWRTGEGWTLVANSQVGASDLAVGPASGGASIDLDLAGVGASFSGLVGVSLDGRSVASATVAGVGTDLSADLDLAGVQWSAIAERLGVDIAITGGGHARLSTAPLDATLDVDLSGAVAGLAITVRGSAPNDLAFTLTRGPGGAEGMGGAAIDLSGRLAWDQEQRAVVSGFIDDQPVDASLTLDDGFTTGRLVVDAPGARVVADLTTAAAAAGSTTGGSRRDVALSAALDGAAFGGLTGTLSATLSNQDGVTSLAALQAEASALPGLGDALPLSLSAAGVLAPVPAVSGTVTAPTLGETARLTVTGGAEGAPDGEEVGASTTVSLTWGDLLAVFETATSRLSVTGTADLDAVAAPFLPEALAGLTLDVDSADLSWSPAAGFGGGLSATLDAPALDGSGISRPVRVSAAAADHETGDPADLEVRAAVSLAPSTPVAVVSLTVPADPLGATALNGAIDIDTDLTALLGLPQLDLRLSGAATIGGTLADPSLLGTLTLAGDVDAQGEFGYAAGEASLSLVGPELHVTAGTSGSTWTADATLDRLPLGTWLTQVVDPYLSLRARADSLGGTRITVEDLVIESRRSRLTGAATIDTGVRVVLQAQVDLSDLRVGGADYHGLLRGPMVLTAPTFASLSAANVTAQLDAAGVGIESLGASVSGTMQLGGNLADPVINAVLQGNGALTGGLRLDAAPGRGRVVVRSDLALGGLVTDLDLRIDQGSTQARGQLRFGEAVLVVADDADGVAMTGAGRLDGWSVALAPNLAGARLRGPLDRLLPGSSGLVDLSLGDGAPGDPPRAAGQPWLRGVLSDLAVAGQTLGDLNLTGAEPGADITLTGATLAASYSPASNDWTLRLVDQALPGGIVVDLQGAGNGLSGRLGGAVRGSEGLPLDLDLALAVAEGIDITIAGQAFGGALDVAGSRASGGAGAWSGTVSLTDAEYGGIALRAVGTLQGTDLVPQAVLTTSATSVPPGGTAGADLGVPPALRATGLVSLGLGGITVDQSVDAAAVTDRVRVRGRLSAPSDLVVTAGAGSWRVQAGGQDLRASGGLTLDLGPATLTLGAARQTAAPTITIGLVSAPSVAASTELVATDLVALITAVAIDGLSFTGTDAARGDVLVSLTPTPRAVLEGFGAELGGFDVEASGSISTAATAITGSLLLPADVPAVSNGGALTLPWRLTGEGAAWTLDSTGELGTIAADLDLETMTLDLTVDLALPGAATRPGGSIERGITSGSVVGRLSYDPRAGASGSFSVADVVLTPAAVGRVSVDADLAVAAGRVTGAAAIDTSGGRVTLTGDAAIAELVPGLDLPGLGGARGSNLELRVRTLELGLIPGIAATVPYLDGALSGVVQLRNGVVLGQLVAPELAVGERLMPASLQLSGVPSSIDAALVVAGTLISGELDGGRLTGSARLERFPLELVAEAFVGPSDVSAALTGVLRFDVPVGDVAAGFVRVATEEVRLERAGVVTIGNLTVTYDDGSLDVERAEFGGRGRWQASGVLSPALLDFSLEAENADFSPLLGLVPDLALYAVGAAGSFTFTATGSFAAPEMSFESDALDIAFAGTRYRIEGTSARLSGVDLTAATTVRGLDPLLGALDFSGGATVMLEPLALRFVDFGFSGSLAVPAFGVIEEISGAISQDALNNPVINLSGMLGAPVSVSGTLVPLDLRAGGTGLALSFPALLVGSATVGLDLRLRGVDGGLSLGGSVLADEIVLDLGARAAETAAAETAALDADASDADAATALTTTDQVAATEAQGARNALAALRFDDLRITAPQRVVLAMNIATIEAALDLTVSGTAAEPNLDGTAEALRGSLRFSGREFTLDRGVVTFTASRGVYPEIAIVATTEFEKSRVLTGSQGVRFVSPSDGQTFAVGLSITGPVEPAPPEEGGFRFDVRPVLTSEALIEVEGEGVGTGVRALSEQELLSLITLGRVEFGSSLIGAGGLGGAVAQGALDTAVDLLIVGELQNALREALGLDVVEIRTSAISSLLDGDAEQFGVSVRLGGYLNPELFASYRIGTADPGDPTFALTNEVALSYALGPLDLDLVGRIDFPTAGTLANPRPELGVGLRYDFGRTLGLDAGVTLSTQRSVVSFGVALRW